MQGPDTIEFLATQDGTCYSVDSSGNVVLGGIKPIEFSPDGWTEATIQNKRNKKYFGLDRSYTIPQGYVEDAAKILKWIFYNKSSEERVYYCIGRQKLLFSDTEYGFYYERLYRGEMDFSKFNHKGEKVTVNVMEGGIPKYISVNENVKYEFNIDDLPFVNVIMDGVVLEQRLNYLMPGVDSPPGFTAYYVPISLLNSEGNSSSVLFGSQNMDGVGDDFSDNFFLQNETGASLTFHIEGTFKYKFIDTGSLFATDWAIWLRKAVDGAHSDTELIHVPGPITNTDYIEVPLSVDVTIDNHVRCYLYGGNIPANIGYSDTRLQVTFKTRKATTYVKAIKPLHLAMALVKKMTNEEFELRSDLMSGFGAGLLLTSGDAVRGLAGSKIKTSWNDFFKFLNCQEDVGTGVVDNQVRVERKAFFVDYNDVIDLGDVSELGVSYNTDYTFSLLQIGYPVQDYNNESSNNPNGKTEFNNTHSYTAPQTRVTQTLDLVCPYRADSIGIEMVRINNENKTTADSSSDNDIFILDCNGDPVFIAGGVGLAFNLNRALNPYFTGVIDTDSVFNVRICPMLLVRKNGRFIRSNFYNLDNQKLIFQTTEKNDTVQIAQPGQPVYAASDDIELSSLASKYFNPIQFTFTAKSPENILKLIEDNPGKTLQFTYLGLTYKALALSEGIQPVNRNAQEFSGLSAPQNDLTPLVNINS